MLKVGLKPLYREAIWLGIIALFSYFVLLLSTEDGIYDLNIRETYIVVKNPFLFFFVCSGFLVYVLRLFSGDLKMVPGKLLLFGFTLIFLVALASVWQIFS